MLRILLVASLAMPGAALATDGKSMAESCGVGFGVDSAAGLDKAFCLGVVHAVQWLAPGVCARDEPLGKAMLRVLTYAGNHPDKAKLDIADIAAAALRECGDKPGALGK
jgi:hypothetical protein